jgi:serine/threonine protein kinase/tetratricopeptide (TPR) repeat protein
MLPHSPMDPERISHYRVDRLLGVGGMGEVYLAEDSTLRRKVALKLLPERFAEDPERVRRFQREARAASALNHPNVVTIYEVGQAENRHYIATEFIDGRTLRDRILSTQPVSIVEMLDVSIGVASALSAAHEAGIVHRDIKPENIMLRPDGYVKVLDFGLAKLLEGDALKESSTGAVMGTLLYISPEQARGVQPDSRSDIYSLGAVMYEMLTRQPPIMTDNFVELAIAIASRDPYPPSTLSKNIPPELDHIVMKALQKDRDRRYQTARELIGDLRTLRQELEFENKLTAIADGRGSGPLLTQQPTALLTFPPRSTSSVFAKIRTSWKKQLASAAVMLACVSVLVYAILRNNVVSGHPIDSVAVLPFVNASGDPNSEYLSDGISESIIDSLSQLPQLQVMARSTVFRYKGKNPDALMVGKELHVRGVVSGQLIQRGDRVIIRASLTDVKNGTQIWGQQYERRLADVVSLQQEMSQEITGELRMKLSGEDRKLLVNRNPVSGEAYQNFLKGRYQLNRYNEDSFRRSIVYFNKAIELEPTYASAHAGLAQAYYGLSNLYMAPKEAMPKVREAARRAVALDDSLPDGHIALALVLVWYDWDFKGGEKEFQRALELNPNDAEAHRFYGDFLIVTGQFERAIVEKKRAETLDPLSILASLDVGRALFYAGRLEDANEQTKRTLDLDDHFYNCYLLEAQIASAQGRADDSLKLIDKAIENGGRTPLLISMWGYLHALAGDGEVARKSMVELSRQQNYTLPLFLARVNAGLGNRDAAMNLLQRLYVDRSESIVWLKVDPTLATLRGDPHFQELARRVGL